MSLFFVILTVSTLALTSYDITGDKDQNSALDKFSAYLVETTAAGVGKVLEKFIMDSDLIDDAMAAYLLNHPHHMELSSVLNRDITKCKKVKKYQHYCMGYNVKTRDLDMGNLGHALPVSADISNRIEVMHGCYIGGNPFKLCLY